LVVVAPALVLVDVGLGEELLVRDSGKEVWFEVEVEAEVGKTSVVEERVTVWGIVTLLEAVQLGRGQNTLGTPTLLDKHSQTLYISLQCCEKMQQYTVLGEGGFQEPPKEGREKDVGHVPFTVAGGQSPAIQLPKSGMNDVS
jgi:hypothetical protein